MKRYKHKFLMLSALMFALIWGCEIEEDPEGAVTAESYYTTENGVEKGVTGLYALYKQNLKEGNLWKDKLIQYMGGDDLTAQEFGPNKEHYRMGDQYNHAEDDALLADFWDFTYRAINACNEFIEIVDPDNFDEAFYNNAIGNARFLRGIMYFDLFLCYGEVPLVLKSEIDHSIETSSSEEILNQVIEDLEFALNGVINNERDNAGSVAAQLINGHASKTAAKAYLAKAHVALAGWPVKAVEAANWQKVYNYTKEIIDSDVYSLLDDYAHNFGNIDSTYPGIDIQPWEGNKEAIWSRITNNSDFHGTQGRFNGYPFGEWGDFFLEWHFYEDMPDNYRTSYSATDDANWSYWNFTAFPYAATHQHPVIMKFQWGVMNNNDYLQYQGVDALRPGDWFPGFEHTWDLSNDVAVIRYSEVLLMYAEACYRTNMNINDGVEKLNWVRRRAYANGLPAVRDTIGKAIEAGDLTTEYWKNTTPAVDYPQAGENDLLTAILNERAWEFLGEIGGVRWFDLTRLELVNEAMEDRKGDSREIPLIGDPANPDNWRFPIPARERVYNPNL